MPFIGKQSTSNSQITNYTTTVGSGGQTNFTVVIDGGDETHVYLNGVLLKETTDYTVSSTQVSLVSAAVENDIVDIKVFRSFALSDAVRTTGGTFSGNVAVTGDLTVDTSTLKVDSANNKVGIGNTNPGDYNASINDLVVGNHTGAHGITIATATDATGYFAFADGSTTAADEYRGLVEYDHSTNKMHLRTDATQRVTIDSSGNVDIGGASHAARRFSIKGTANDNSQNAIEVLNSDNTTIFKLLCDGNLELSTGNITMGGANKGITFQDVANASTPVSSGNTLDHFEEGDFDVGISTDSGNPSTNNGKYVRIGQLVHVQFYVGWTNNTNNDNSVFYITNLPFTPQANNNYGGASIGYVGSANMNDALGIVHSAQNKIYFHQNDGSASTLTNTDIHSRGLGHLIMTATYYAN